MNLLDQTGDFMRAWRNCGIRVTGVWLKPGPCHQRLINEDFWQLLVVAAGSSRITSAIDTLQLAQGSVLLCRPGLSLGLELPAGSQVFDIGLLSLPAAGQTTPWLKLPTPLVVDNFTDATQHAMLHELSMRMDGATWCDANSAMDARFCLDRFLWQLITTWANECEKPLEPSGPLWLREAIQASWRHLWDQAFQGAAFARLAGRSSRQVNRALTTYYGMSSKRFLVDLRLQRALHLLRQDPDMATATVARRCGFSGARHFCDSWQRHYGKPFSAR